MSFISFHLRCFPENSKLRKLAISIPMAVPEWSEGTHPNGRLNQKRDPVFRTALSVFECPSGIPIPDQPQRTYSTKNAE
jgi:hypothetical protein